MNLELKGFSKDRKKQVGKRNQKETEKRHENENVLHSRTR
jgi:hypothetical protein